MTAEKVELSTTLIKVTTNAQRKLRLRSTFRSEISFSARAKTQVEPGRFQMVLGDRSLQLCKKLGVRLLASKNLSRRFFKVSSDVA